MGGVPGGVLGGVIGGTGDGVVMDYDQGPRPIKITQPKYPPEAFVKKIEGTVEVEILIDSTGRVAKARVVRSIPALDRGRPRHRAAVGVLAGHQERPAGGDGRERACHVQNLLASAVRCVAELRLKLTTDLARASIYGGSGLVGLSSDGRLRKTPASPPRTPASAPRRCTACTRRTSASSPLVSSAMAAHHEVRPVADVRVRAHEDRARADRGQHAWLTPTTSGRQSERLRDGQRRSGRSARCRGRTREGPSPRRTARARPGRGRGRARGGCRGRGAW